MPTLTEAATESKTTSMAEENFATLQIASEVFSDEAFAESPQVERLKDLKTLGSGLGTLGYLTQLFRVAIPLMASDLLSVAFSICAAYSLVVWFGKPINYFLPFLAVCIVIFAIIFWVVGCYSAVGVAPAKELRKTIRGCVAAGIVISMGLLLIDNSWTPYLQMVTVALPGLMFVIPLARCLTKDWMQANKICIPFYFVGDRNEVLLAYQQMSRFSWTLLSPVGRYSLSRSETEPNSMPVDAASVSSRVSACPDPYWSSRMETDVPSLGTVDQLFSEPHKNQVYWLFFAGNPKEETMRFNMKRLEQVFPQVVWVAPPYSTTTLATTLLNCGLGVGLRSEKSQWFLGPRIQKRTMDIIISATLLLLTLPLLLVIAVGIKVSSRGPVLLRNPRIGPDRKPFHAWKFRSMVANADEVLQRCLEENPSLRVEWERDQKLKQDPRVTVIGRVIRKTSLDELPQLWNVLVGQMSLVGPRPILVEEVAKYGDTYDVYLSMRPGITGLWQVSGRNDTSYPERLAMVQYYVQNWSVWLDLHILLRTIRTVLLCEGSY